MLAKDINVVYGKYVFKLFLGPKIVFLEEGHRQFEI